MWAYNYTLYTQNEISTRTFCQIIIDADEIQFQTNKRKKNHNHLKFHEISTRWMKKNVNCELDKQTSHINSIMILTVNFYAQLELLAQTVIFTTIKHLIKTLSP